MTKDSVQCILNKKIEKSYFTIKQIYFSSIALAVHLVPYRALNNDAQDELKQIALDIRDIAIQSGLIFPILIYLEVSNDNLQIVKEWQRDQNWHRGRFLLVYDYDINASDGKNGEKSKDSDAKTKNKDNKCDIPQIINDLMSPGAPDLKGYEPEVKDISVIYDFKKELKKIRDDVKEKLNIDFGNIDQKVDKVEDTNSSKIDEIISKVTRIHLSNFKGIKECDVNLGDSDIILITGPNGSGKSSLVEALILGLTGFHPQIDLLRNKNEKDKLEHLFFYGDDNFNINLNLSLETKKIKRKLNFKKREEKVVIKFSNDNENNKHLEEKIIIKRNYLDKRLQDEYEKKSGFLLFRLTSFLPRYYEYLFDDMAKAEGYHLFSSLRELFEPINPECYNLLTDALQELNEIEEKKQDFDSLSEYVISHYEKFFNGFIKSLPNVVKQKIKLDSLRVNINTDKMSNIKKYFKSLKKQIEDELNIHLEKWSDLDNQIRRKCEEKKEFQRLKQEFNQLKDNIENLCSEVNKLFQGEVILDYSLNINHSDDINSIINKIEEFLNVLSNKVKEIKKKNEFYLNIDNSDILLSIFKNLKNANQLENWKRQLQRYGFYDLLNELTLVNIDKVLIIYDSFKRWINGNIKQITKDIEDYITMYYDKLNHLKDEWNNLKSSSRCIWDDTIAYLIEEHEFPSQLDKFMNYSDNISIILYDKIIDEYNEFINTLQDKLKISKELKDIFEKTLNNVLKRFVMSEGLQKLNLQDPLDNSAKSSNGNVIQENRQNFYYVIQASEQCQEKGVNVPPIKRTREYFSEGQKAQIATAWMIAQRELAHAAKEKGIIFPHRIIIMDDPSATFDMTNLHSQAILLRQLAYHPEPERRYQLFIVSHHEQFTSRLLDLLCPPEGFSMKLLRMKNWTPEKGPEINLYEVENIVKDEEGAVNALKDAMQIYGEI